MAALTYPDSVKFSTGVLALLSALAVHSVFFSLLYFGATWHVKPSPNMVVEMWDKLPDTKTEIAPPAPLPPPPAPEPVAAPKVVELPPVTKAEIEFKETKKKKKEPAKKEQSIAETKSQQIEQTKQLEMQKRLAEEARAAQENERIQSMKAQMKAEMDAATQEEVARYKDMIQAKIRRSIVMPPDVAESAEAKFMVIVLPGGTVVSVKLLQSSGNGAYDNAAERAIYKAQPLPIPQAAELARMFRELRLSVKP